MMGSGPGFFIHVNVGNKSTYQWVASSLPNLDIRNQTAPAGVHYLGYKTENLAGENGLSEVHSVYLKTHHILGPTREAAARKPDSTNHSAVLPANRVP